MDDMYGPKVITYELFKEQANGFWKAGFDSGYALGFVMARCEKPDEEGEKVRHPNPPSATDWSVSDGAA